MRIRINRTTEFYVNHHVILSLRMQYVVSVCLYFYPLFTVNIFYPLLSVWLIFNKEVNAFSLQHDLDLFLEVVESTLTIERS